MLRHSLQKVVNMLERIQRRGTKSLEGVKFKPYVEGLKSMNLCLLEYCDVCERQPKKLLSYISCRTRTYNLYPEIDYGRGGSQIVGDQDKAVLTYEPLPNEERDSNTKQHNRHITVSLVFDDVLEDALCIRSLTTL